MPQMQRVGLGQPHMPVNSRTLVEPSVAKACVHADHQIILPAIIEKVACIETKRRIAVVVAPDEISVQEHERAAKRPVKFNRDAPSSILFQNVEGAPVPAHAGLGISSSQRLVAVAVLLFVVHKRQLERPIVRQIQVAPFGVVKFRSGEPELARLGEISLAHAESQIAQRVAGMSLKKLPAKVEQQMLPRSNSGHRLRRQSVGIARQQRLGAPHRTRDQRCARLSKTRTKKIAAGEGTGKISHSAPQGLNSRLESCPMPKALAWDIASWDFAL